MRNALVVLVVVIAATLPPPAGAQSPPAPTLAPMVIGVVSGGQVIAGGVPLSSGSWGTDYITVSHALRVGAGYAILRVGAPYGESTPVVACSNVAHGIDVLVLRVKSHAKLPVVEWGDSEQLKAGDELTLYPRREFSPEPSKVRFVHINLLVWAGSRVQEWSRAWHNVMVGEGYSIGGFSGSPWVKDGRVFGLHKGRVQPGGRGPVFVVAEAATRVRQCLGQVQYDALIPPD
jgi:hypothetical protein